ncbi:uncharacterized protein M421DRAFT_104106 [Didymella exigua CBS 183.55]|uniref:Heterokaryon incompatibility domain-containing protein n=1 Tax=Didymella exigua CBS 183.55 TaxID=1150837 RepID=A0A6A5R700_9PLEO|nr:uncharacterized protein M421DRAFT_104106 [Didymella exigua CBS 183.55]KAF1923941.1 hypothetical protein M421DRAFT_104106 [Didymella exigua CBS 183.55]
MYPIDAYTLKLERFDDEARIPPYAILSHTWGESEVTFEHIRKLNELDGLGAWNIRKTCEQALKENLCYAWVDTCCVDKKSSAELSEAINSTFRWYRQSFVCYAFLQDVTHGGEDIFEDLTGARRSTRGWTLQELFAPPHMALYDQR